MHRTDISRRLATLPLPALLEEAARYGRLAWQAEQDREQAGKPRPHYPRYEHIHCAIVGEIDKRDKESKQ